MVDVEKSNFERFPVTKGDYDELRLRLTTLSDVLLRSGKEDLAYKIMSKYGDAIDGKALKDAVDYASRMVQMYAIGKNNLSDEFWYGVYSDLFGNSLLEQESWYTPKEGEVEEIVKYCLEKGVRVKNGVPEGSRA